MKLVTVVFASLLVAWMYAPAAFAQGDDQVVAPPGNSGVEEYLEIVPGAGGDRPASPTDKPGQDSPASTNAASGSSSPSEVLGAKTARELNRLGEDGRAAAAVAAAGAPPADRSEGDKAKQQKSEKGSAPEAAPLDAKDGGGAAAVAGALAGSGGGMGLAFPLVLLGAFAAALGLLAIRRSARRG